MLSSWIFGHCDTNYRDFFNHTRMFHKIAIALSKMIRQFMPKNYICHFEYCALQMRTWRLIMHSHEVIGWLVVEWYLILHTFNTIQITWYSPNSHVMEWRWSTWSYNWQLRLRRLWRSTSTTANIGAHVINSTKMDSWLWKPLIILMYIKFHIVYSYLN